MILLVEDDAVTRKSTAEILKAKGFPVRTAGTYVEALQALSEKCPEMLIIDLVLPCTRSGLELLKLDVIRKNPDCWQRLIVVITTALDGMNCEDTLPPNTYMLQKPFPIDRLVELLRGRQIERQKEYAEESDKRKTPRPAHY